MDQDQRTKLAENVPALLQEAASHIERLSTDNVALEKRASDFEHELRAMKIARRMEERNIQGDLSFDQKVASLREATPEKLASIETGMEFAARGWSLGSANNGAEDTSSAGASADPLGDFIASNHAYST